MADARLRQAHALAGVEQSSRAPQVSASLGWQGERQSSRAVAPDQGGGRFSRQWQAGLQLDGAEVFPDLAAALAACGAGEQVFVMGGAEIYALALPLATALELTEFDVQRPADAFFPAWDDEAFREVRREQHHHRAGEPDGFTYRFVRLERQR